MLQRKPSQTAAPLRPRMTGAHQRLPVIPVFIRLLSGIPPPSCSAIDALPCHAIAAILAMPASAGSPLSICRFQKILNAKSVDKAAVQDKEPEMAIRPICPSAQQCANREVRLGLLEHEVARLQGLDAIREDVANLLQEEIAELTRKLHAMEEATKGDQFRRAKIVISKALHPNNFAGDEVQQRTRGDIFREVWPEIERIERG
jgi:hypothetical protein